MDTFGEMRQFHIEDMRSLALTYMLTGERKYGEAARRFIVDASHWDPEEISSILDPYRDEVGLKLVRAGVEVFDWIYDILSEEDRSLVSRTIASSAVSAGAACTAISKTRRATSWSPSGLPHRAASAVDMPARTTL